eukprot:CAMPEP_0202686816 /NCGR_PEP_ID=MMETSP1385-20130828/2578_1 /ASSEMBLY_ACC=CAM_ASM_000861 /TAXON_ID=933848 /ORGANISM="Elphidium margaritaceum" /LENGTH=419 /DNA_ID=CAMNT_0049341475 /DNA_START=35 /DNA_END=1294 /DNA_ORIENTATION=+
MDPFQTQQQIRQNASELSDYLSDLQSWGKQMQHKEKKPNTDTSDVSKAAASKQQHLPPIRNSSQAKAQLQRNQELAAKYQSEGNEQFKAGKYASAIASYTKGIECLPSNAVLFSNRAMAKLKVNDYEGAEIDCDASIELDATLTKAWFRRGLARKMLKKYNTALQDFESVLRLDAKNKAAEKLKIEMQAKLKVMLERSKKPQFLASKSSKKNKAKTDKKSTSANDDKSDEKEKVTVKQTPGKMQRIVIEECSDSDSDSAVGDEKVNMDRKPAPSKQSGDKTQSNVDDQKQSTEAPSDMDEFNLDVAPTNFIAFEKLWSRAKTAKNRSLILLALKQKKMDKIIKNMMDDTLFAEMICAIHYIAIHSDIKDALVLLNKVTQLDRFEMIAMFLNETEKQLLQEMKQKCVAQKLQTFVFDEFE